jgi:hypothetical protein
MLWANVGGPGLIALRYIAPLHYGGRGVTLRAPLPVYQTLRWISYAYTL